VERLERKIDSLTNSFRRKKKDKKPRRRNYRGPMQISRVPAPALIQAMIDRSHKTIDFGRAGAMFMETLLNPLGQDGAGGIKAIAYPVPDGLPGARLIVMCTATATVNASDYNSGACLISLLFPNAATIGGIIVSGGSDAGHAPTVTSQTPDVNNTTDFKEDALALAAINHHTKKLRIVASGIRVEALSSLAETSGSARAYYTRRSIKDTAATFTSYDTLLAQGDEQVHILNPEVSGGKGGGCTARGFWDAESDTMNAAPEVDYNTADENLSRVPCLLLTGMSTTTSLTVQAKIVLEIEASASLCPFVTSGQFQTPYEDEFKAMVNFCNAQDHSTSAHSFWSFLKKVGQGVAKGFHFVESNMTPIGLIGGALKHMLPKKAGKVVDTGLNLLSKIKI